MPQVYSYSYRTTIKPALLIDINLEKATISGKEIDFLKLSLFEKLGGVEEKGICRF